RRPNWVVAFTVSPRLESARHFLVCYAAHHRVPRGRVRRPSQVCRRGLFRCALPYVVSTRSSTATGNCLLLADRTHAEPACDVVQSVPRELWTESHEGRSFPPPTPSFERAFRYAE